MTRCCKFSRNCQVEIAETSQYCSSTNFSSTLVTACSVFVCSKSVLRARQTVHLCWFIRDCHNGRCSADDAIIQDLIGRGTNSTVVGVDRQASSRRRQIVDYQFHAVSAHWSRCLRPSLTALLSALHRLPAASFRLMKPCKVVGLPMIYWHAA